MERIIPLVGESAVPESPFSSGIPATGMERLWSLAVATSGNRWQMGSAENGSDKPNSFALGCDQLPESFHGKEGVDGSSPSEGSAKAPHIAAFSVQRNLHELQYAVGMERIMELSGSARLTRLALWRFQAREPTSAPARSAVVCDVVVPSWLLRIRR
jgi:hypothetical protein